MGTTYYSTKTICCLDCGNSVTEGPRCVPCTRNFEDVGPEDACENCNVVLVGSELRWAEDNESPYCKACASEKYWEEANEAERESEMRAEMIAHGGTDGYFIDARYPEAR